MTWYRLLLLIGMVLTGIPVLAQVGQLGPSGDFRVDDRFRANCLTASCA